MNINYQQLEEKFEQWAAMCGVAAPRIEFKGAAPHVPGGIIQGQYNPHLNFISIFDKGMDEHVAKHEFIHYLRHQMGLNKDMTVLHKMGISNDKMAELHDYEEGRTYYLTEQPWAKILHELKHEKKEIAISEDNKGKFRVDSNAIADERRSRQMAQMMEIMSSPMASLLEMLKH